jgi:tripartite-type tricarboxylate transporter receptor subunit TctC
VPSGDQTEKKQGGGIMRLRQWRSAVLAVVWACVPVMAAAQAFPDRPVTLVVPWSAGGGTDVAMRSLADAASKHLGQRIVIENRAGASGTIGPTSVAKNARPDGYTVTQIPITVFRLPHMTKVEFDALNDFTWIVGVTGYTFGVVVRADAPWKTWQELIAWSKANPGKFTYATPGHGTSLHITMEELAAKDGVQWLQVPFKGNADATAALLGGHVSASADSTGWGELIDAGKLRMLTIWSAERSKRWPTVPTLKELGYGIVSNSPYGIAGPKGMDPKVVKILHDAFKKGMEDPVYQKTIARLDQEDAYLSTEDYAAYAKRTFEEQRVVVNRLGLKQ